MPETTETPRRSAPGDVQFVELPPIVLDAAPPAPAYTDLDAAERRAIESLPATGPGIVRIGSAGSRLVLSPTDREVALRLDALRVGLGQHYDRKQERKLNRFDQLLRRGASGFESICLLLTAGGIRYEVPESTTRAIARYRARLDRARTRVPRMVWRDDEERSGGEVVAEITLGRAVAWRSR